MMKIDKMLTEALSMYEERGEKAIYEINRNVEQKEYLNSVDEIRKSNRIKNLYNKGHEASPEDILMEKEEYKETVKLLLWIDKQARQVNETEYEVWRLSALGVPMKEIATKCDCTLHNLYKIKRRMQALITELVEMYAKLHSN